MKKVSLFLTAMLLSLSLIGCNTNKDKNDNAATDNTDKADQGTNDENTNNDNTMLEVSQEAADSIAELDGVESAYVLVTDENAYAAVVLDGNVVDDTDNTDNADAETGTDTETDTGTDTETDTETDTNNNNDPDQVLSPDLEDKIAEKVREGNENIQNVYVSLDPDFVERMTGYVDEINQGEPVEGFFGEFTEAIQRVFPDAK